jgi:hypothetical protein
MIRLGLAAKHSHPIFAMIMGRIFRRVQPLVIVRGPLHGWRTIMDLGAFTKWLRRAAIAATFCAVGAATLGSTTPAQAQNNPYCYAPNYNPAYCQYFSYRYPNYLPYPYYWPARSSYVGYTYYSPSIYGYWPFFYHYYWY